MKTLFAVLTLSATLLLSHTAAAADNNEFANCVLVPFASFSGDTTTTVGLTSKSGGVIYWSFFDQDGSRLDTGSFATAANLFDPFILSQEVQASLAGEVGYLLFCLDDDENGEINEDETSLAANAFYFEPSRNDAALIPTIAVFSPNLDDAASGESFANLTEDPIENLNIGAGPESTVYLQYFTDGVENNSEETIVYIYSSDAPGASVSVRALSPDGDQTLTMPLGSERLNVVDVESIAGINDASLIGPGLLIFEVPEDVNHLFAFSIVRSQIVGAAQTLLSNVDSN